MAVGDALFHLLRHPLATGKDSGIVVGLQRQEVHSGKAIAQVNGVSGEHKPLPVRSTVNQEPQRFRSVMEGCEGHDLQAAHLELDPIRYSGNQVAAQGVGSPLTCENLHTGFDEVHNALCVVFVLVADQAGPDVGKVKAQSLLDFAEGDTALQEDHRLAIADHIAVPMGGAGKRGEGHMGFSSFFSCAPAAASGFCPPLVSTSTGSVGTWSF